LVSELHYGAGYGEVQPTVIDQNGDATGRVTGIVWQSWGQQRATGSGTGWWVGDNQTVSQGSSEPVQVVAFNLGMCDGVYMYQAVEWYFPQHGGTFDPNRATDICDGKAGHP
jgi:hypothetical protein